MIILESDLKIQAIINRKQQGIDCTETESAEIKQWVKETLICTNFGHTEIEADLQMLFPLEYGEAIEERENKTDGALPLRDDSLHEVAMVAAIMAHNDFDNAYAVTSGGSIETVDKIGQWAIEFYQKHINTDWEYFKEHCEEFGYAGISDWDEAVIQFTEQKIKELQR